MSGIESINGQAFYIWREPGGSYPFGLSSGSGGVFAGGLSFNGNITVGGTFWQYNFGEQEIQPVYWKPDNSGPPSYLNQHVVIHDISADGSIFIGQDSMGNFIRSAPTETNLLPVTISWPGFGVPSLYGSYGLLHPGRRARMSADGSIIAGNGPSAFRWTKNEGLVYLPFLDGTTNNAIFDISCDGTTIVGQSGNQACVWYRTNPPVGLGFLPGGNTSIAGGVSRNGSIIVGYSSTANGTAAFIWDSVNQLREIKTVLQSNGLALTSWKLTEAVALSDDGEVIIGNGINTDGVAEAWKAFIPSFRLNLAVLNQTVVLQWNSIAGQTYRAQSISDLAETNWIDISTNLAATNTISITNEINAQRFYRVLSSP